MQMVSRFEEVIAQLSQLLPANAATEQAPGWHEPLQLAAMSGGHLENADEIARFDEAKKRRIAHRPLPFAERRCPICASFGCGGC